MRAVGLPTTIGVLMWAAGGDRQLEGYLLGLVLLGELSLDMEGWIDDLTVVSPGRGSAFK